MHRVLACSLVVLALAACGGDPAPVDLVPIPTQTPGPLLNLGPAACPAALGEGTLVRHDEFGLAVQGDPLFPPFVVVWPNGWVARDVDGVRELLDGSGRVMGREGDHFSAGGGYYPPNDWFHPCGEMTFTPA
jgi:hypothetical protein